ncbi:MAG: transcriptional regulator, LuxR family [Phenylobacterium sp.]|nr:transcriptional regulator, LuxR family [Phenylobacterium sp.]
MLHAVDARNLKLSALTPQERECLRLVAQQRSSKEIALELGISKASVDTYCNRARAKLGVSSRRAAARLIMGAEPAPPAAGVAPAAQPPSAAVVTVAVLPPLSELGPMARLVVIVAGAAVLALAFGMLLAGLQSLDTVVDAARQAAQGRPG